MASEATGVSGLAGRYAGALFDLADRQNLLDRIAGDLDTLHKMIGGSADLQRLLRSPLIGRDRQEAAIGAIAAKAGFETLTRNFVSLVARNRRLFALTGMIDAFHKLLAERRGEVTADVTAAQPLSTGQIETLTERLKRAVGSKIAVHVRVDPAIIGGLVVKVGSRMVDSSLRSKLQRLQLAMRGI